MMYLERVFRQVDIRRDRLIYHFHQTDLPPIHVHRGRYQYSIRLEIIDV